MSVRAERFLPSTQIQSWMNGDVLLDGSSENRAAKSAQDIKKITGTNIDGFYWIDVPGGVGPKKTYCIMNSLYDGGGWMMAMKATRGSTFTYTSSYWTSANTLNTHSVSTADADAKFDVMNYFQAKDIFAVFPDISNGGSISGSTRGWTWLQNNFYSGQRITPISFFSGGQVYVSSPDSFSGFGSPWSAQSGMRWYGFNYTQNGGNRVRWGFGWNNEGDHNSNDVTGGIGVARPNYSAGDAIYCCQSQTGINRSARVEVYIR